MTSKPCSFDDPATGRIWLYWGSDFAPIRVRELARNRTAFAPGSTAVATVYPSSSPYQSLVEGAWMIYHNVPNVTYNASYYLLFSGNNCCGADAAYAVMAARR